MNSVLLLPIDGFLPGTMPQSVQFRIRAADEHDRPVGGVALYLLLSGDGSIAAGSRSGGVVLTTDDAGTALFTWRRPESARPASPAVVVTTPDPAVRRLTIEPVEPHSLEGGATGRGSFAGQP